MNIPQCEYSSQKNSLLSLCIHQNKIGSNMNKHSVNNSFSPFFMILKYSSLLNNNNNIPVDITKTIPQ